MARVNWQALQIEYVKAYAKTGVSVQEWCRKKGLNFATAKRYIKKPDTLFNGNKNRETQDINCEKENQDKSVSYEESCETNCETNCETAKTAKQVKKVTGRPPIHSGYARYFKDDSTFEQVIDFGLKDEIDLMRQRAVAAIQSIEQFKADLQTAVDKKERLALLELIESAENALDRAVGRVQSLNSADASIQLMLETIEYRKAQTKETLLKADKLAQELNIKANGNNTIQFLDDF